MAVWQFVIDFVPQQFLENTPESFAELTSFKKHQGAYFGDTAVSIEALLPYLQRLGTLEDWTQNSEGFKRYQGEADNDISVGFDERTRNVESVGCRLDMRQPTEAFMYGILTLAADLDCQLLTRRGHLFEPTLPALLQAMEQSNAARFVADPLKFLDDLSTNDPAV